MLPVFFRDLQLQRGEAELSSSPASHLKATHRDSVHTHRGFFLSPRCFGARTEVLYLLSQVQTPPLFALFQPVFMPG